MFNRRDFLKKTAIIGATSLTPFSVLSASKDQLNRNMKCLVLGIDGMDIKLATEYMKKGLLPNFQKLANYGTMTTVKTTFPPQSPVAWSSFSVGASTKVHGIYDFIHREAATMQAYLSTSKVEPPEKTFKFGEWEIPFSEGKVENLRGGKPFWEYLDENGVPTTIFKMPGNFPSKSGNVRLISGMGTPDMRGGYGSFTYFTTAPEKVKKSDGGIIVPIVFKDNYVKVALEGPINTLKVKKSKIEIPIEIWRDPTNSVVKLNIQGTEYVLKKGEWTNWIKLSFELVPHLSSVSGIVKLYIKSVHSEFSMYVSPINIDPSEPALPVISSKKYGKELANAIGYFYTQGLPEDTQALSSEVLTDREYLDLSSQILDERKKMMIFELDHFSKLKSGMLFYYFCSIDLDCHMFWRTIDPKHPLYSEKLHHDEGKTIQDLYIEMDKNLEIILKKFDISDPNFRLYVMSDHGFSTFHRQINLNTWLYKSGFLTITNENDLENGEFFSNVKWDKTLAYGLGINSLYLNIKGREKDGIVHKDEVSSILDKITEKLMTLVDPKDNKKAVTSIWRPTQEEHNINPHAPDLVIGWNEGFRSSSDSVLGKFNKEIFIENDKKWSGDHCIDPAFVPGILFSNKKITNKDAELADITTTILNEFRITIPKHMKNPGLYKI